MALRPVEVHVPFRGGVETRSDPKAVPPTQLLVLENGVFSRATSIKKRNGYESLSSVVDGSASVVTDRIRMAVREPGELLEFTANRCYSRQTGTDQLSDTGAVYSVVGSDRPLVKTGTQQLQPDHATLSGVTVAAWEDSNGGVWWSVEDATSGRIYRAATQADASGISPRCVPCGANLHIYYAVSASSRIYVIVVNPAAPSAAVSPVILTDDLSSADPVYDVCPTGRSATPAAITWFENGTTNIRLGYVEQSGVLGSPASGHPSVLTYAAVRIASTPLAVAFLDVDGANADVIGIAFVSTAQAGSFALFNGGGPSTPLSASTAGSVYSGTSIQRVAFAIVNATTTATAWEEAAAAASNRFTATRLFDGSLTSLTIRSVGLASRAFVIDGEAFATFVHDTTYFNTYVTLRLRDGISVGRHAPAEAAGAPPRRHLSSAPVVGSVATVALPFRERLVSENNDKFRETGIRLFTLDFDNDASHQYAQIGAGLYLAGACPQHYDGRQWTEQGFHFGPELIVTVNAGGGSLTSGTTYLYRAWYERTDFQGEVHRGPVSIGTLVTMGGGDTQVTLTLPTLRVTQGTNTRICVARSLAADTGDTAELFRVTSLDPTTAGTANGYVANSTSVDTVSFIDRMSDATLRTQEPLYTNGGILSNDPSALGSVVFRGQSRLFFTDPSDGLTLRYSQPLDPGYGLEIPPDLAIGVDPFGGDITAGAFQDGRGVIWKASSIFLFQGDGPAPNGDTSTSGFSTPQLITSDVGCTDPSSIVLTPNGHMFKSAKGIYLLARDGSVSYVGANVEAYNTQTVRRATVMPDRTQIVFLTDSGLSLLYDHYHQQWSTFTNHEGLDAAVVNGQYHYLRTDGRVFRETPGVYLDDNARIRLRLETAWIHMLPQLAGFQRIWHLILLGTWVSPHQLGIQYQTDYTPGWTDSYWYDATGLSSSTGWITGANAATIGLEPITGTNYGDGNYGDGNYGGTAPGLYEWRLHLDEAGQAIQFRFEDFEAEGFADASFELTELILTGGVKANAIKPFTTSRSL
jgi:hypothetical protein